MNIRDKNQWELVSIGMPVFNDRKYIRQSIQSVLDQTYSNFELIISDDGSTDGSMDICREFESIDSRIRYIRQEKNLGVSRNMRFLLDQGRGAYFMWAGNDDILHPEFISKLRQQLDADKTAVMAFCTTMLIDDEDKEIEIVRTNYSGRTAYERLKKLVDLFEDSCGYGLFKKSEIEGVKFPVWRSVNKKRAYNNIYPTICYYLSKGQYVFYNSPEPLFFKRIKFTYNNHNTPYTTSFVKGVGAFLLWKMNMVYCSLEAIFRGSRSSWLVLRIMPTMIWKWLVMPFWETLLNKFKALRKKQIKFY